MGASGGEPLAVDSADGLSGSTDRPERPAQRSASTIRSVSQRISPSYVSAGGSPSESE